MAPNDCRVGKTASLSYMWCLSAQDLSASASLQRVTYPCAGHFDKDLTTGEVSLSKRGLLQTARSNYDVLLFY